MHTDRAIRDFGWWHLVSETLRNFPQWLGNFRCSIDMIRLRNSCMPCMPRVMAFKPGLVQYRACWSNGMCLITYANCTWETSLICPDKWRWTSFIHHMHKALRKTKHSKTSFIDLFVDLFICFLLIFSETKNIFGERRHGVKLPFRILVPRAGRASNQNRQLDRACAPFLRPSTCMLEIS